ncbi:MAG: betaine--homocysteine S-methyltransferase [Rhodobacteraceae bacterium]|nr:betaine--homocysteine S-methyltransferase [Paracoccaceae bacterium]
MSGIIHDLLKEKGWLLADGATGTNLFNMGLTAGEAPELWNRDQPEKILALYESFLRAGVDMFLTNSFGCNRARLNLHESADDCFELAEMSASLAGEAIARQNCTAIVAGSVGPTGEIMEPLGTLTYTRAVEYFHEQAEGLKSGGADVLWIETISSREEFLAAQEACQLAGMPWCGTMSFDTVGYTMMGITPRDLVELVSEMDNKPEGFGANCGAGASDMILTLLAISELNPELPVIAKGNAGIPQIKEGKIHYSGSPEIMAIYAELARNAGARIIGGCCGTTPQHLEQMKTRLERTPMGPKPTHEEVRELLGEPSFTPGGKKRAKAGNRRRRQKK